MTISLRAAIQHGDLASDELGELSLDDVFARLSDHDWEEDLRLAVERKFLGKESCPPGFYLYRPNTDYLALYPASGGRFFLDFAIDHSRGFLGFGKTKTIRLAPLPLTLVQDLIRVFATGTSAEILAAIGDREVVDGGIVW